MSTVTIILTTLNSERFLARSIDSCLDQTYGNLELLIVDGGSQDRTLEIVAGYQDPRIRLIHQEDNAGRLPGALNVGMAQAKGEFITWTQDDCWYEPNAIEMMIQYLQSHSTVALVYCDYWLVDSFTRSVLYREVSDPERILNEDVIQQCFLFRREVYETIGPQDVRYYSVHEVPWRIKIANSYRIAPLHVPLQYYLLHSSSLTGRLGGYTEQRKMVKAILDEGHIRQTEYRHRLAAIDIHQGYEMFVRNGNYHAFRRHLFTGLLKDWHWLLNVGLWKMLAASLTPRRARYRELMYDAWQKEQNDRQADLIAKHRPPRPEVTEDMFDA